MKLKSTLIVAMTVVSASAFAQDNQQTATTEAPASVAQPAPIAPSGQAASPTATSTMQMAEAAPQRNLKAELLNKNIIAKQAIQNGDGTTIHENYAGLKYNLGEGKSIGLRQLFIGTSAGNKETTWAMDNTYLHYTDGKLATLPADVNLSLNARVYLPTGEKARNVTKENGRLRAHFIAGKSVGKFDFAANLLNQYYSQSQDTFVNAKGEVEGNQEWYISPYAEAVYNVSEKVTVYAYAGTEHQLFRNNTSKQNITMGPGVTWAPISQLTVDFSIDNSYGHTTGGTALKDEDLSAVLVLSASI